MFSVTPEERPRIARLAAISSIALALGACFGGGGGGEGGGFTPRTPPPPSPPPAQASAIAAPARATTGTAAGPAMHASAGGPNFTTGAVVGTKFPLLQTALVLDAAIKPDTAINSAGGTATVTADGLSINIAGNGEVPSFSDPNLDWTRAGWWALSAGAWDYGGGDLRGVFVAGYETPASQMPPTGTAKYIGGAMGSMFAPGSSSNGLPCNCTEVSLSGTATFTADFGARTLNGTLTDMVVPVGWDFDTVPWNDVAFTSTILGNSFSGTTRVTSAPPGAMGLNATGTLEGKFFGPSAQEAGAVWTLFDGTKAAIGTLTGKQD